MSLQKQKPMKVFSFLTRKKSDEKSDGGNNSFDRYQRKVAQTNLNKFNKKLDLSIKRFAKNHRLVPCENDFITLHDAAAAEISADKVSQFLYGKAKENVHLFFQKNYVCLRRKNALFMITSIECFPSGKVNISYRTKKHNRAVTYEEHKEFV